MFTTLKYRRQVAVLAALAMVASVMVAAPAVAADDPSPSYRATFDACAGAPAAGFEDVADNHSNAGDIDCIVNSPPKGRLAEGNKTTSASAAPGRGMERPKRVVAASMPKQPGAKNCAAKAAAGAADPPARVVRPATLACSVSGSGDTEWLRGEWPLGPGGLLIQSARDADPGYSHRFTPVCSPAARPECGRAATSVVGRLLVRPRPGDRPDRARPTRRPPRSDRPPPAPVASPSRPGRLFRIPPGPTGGGGRFGPNFGVRDMAQIVTSRQSWPGFVHLGTVGVPECQARISRALERL